MTDKELGARLEYTGSVMGYDRVYHLMQDETTIGRSGNIRVPRDFASYIGEGFGNEGLHLSIALSREHARIIREGGAYVLEDVGSLVGTYVNGVKLGEEQPEPWKERYGHPEAIHDKIRDRNRGRATLRDGDVITLGQEMFEDKHEFVFRLGGVDPSLGETQEFVFEE